MSWWRCINEVVVVLCRWRASPTSLGRPRTSTSFQWRIPAQALHAGQVRSNPFDERSGSRFSCYESQSLAHQWGGDGRRERSPSTRFLGSTRHPRRAALKWRHQSTNVLVRCYFLALGFAVYFVLNDTYSDCCCVVYVLYLVWNCYPWFFISSFSNCYHFRQLIKENMIVHASFVQY